MKHKKRPHLASILVLWAMAAGLSFGLTQYAVRAWLVATLAPSPWALRLASGSQSGIVLKEPWIEPFKRIQVSYDEDYLPEENPFPEGNAQPQTDLRLEELRLLLHRTELIHSSDQATENANSFSTEPAPADNVMAANSSDIVLMQQYIN